MLFRLASAAATAILLLTASAAPTPTPSNSTQTPGDGFPNPNATQLDAINRQADGTLSDAAPPAKLSNDSLPAFQLIAFNENFEVAFFTSLLYNVTNDVPGFEVPWPAERASLIGVLKTVLAQEELHALNAEGVLKHFGASLVPEPCTYTFPTTRLGDAIALAETFTSVVLGTLQDAAQLLAENGDAGPVRTIASVIGQEGEQNGFYRSLLNRKPSQKPFLTTSVAAFAFSVLQGFVVSCPFDIADIPIPIFPALSVESGLSAGGAANVEPIDQDLTFSANLTGVADAAKLVGNATATEDSLFITYFTGQDSPLSESITNASWAGDVLTFHAAFPYTDFVLDGLTIAALTVGQNFSSPDDVPAKTLAAPGLIQVNDPLI
ncbi:sexual development protein [Grosmannia clavigera kw1407]|uniref:Sexual development protein n=1 Tax=Grosmannia clavigera (strain kw1407 / UAMH 11150) TaxID=655863 RepID=F0XJU3_GROCL|nr:sexual development protein [Grosmannia clavigera kw1407]EFX02357.1 sexual development protein [Grosmannia clavigera kw1407]